MLEYLNQIDAHALLAINGLHGLFQDALWWMVSAKWSSALLMLSLVLSVSRRPWRHAVLVLTALVLAFVLADQLSSGLIKHLVERLRPTRDPSLESLVHVVNGYRGGAFGFVSSHAANSFAASTLVALVMRRRAVTWSLIIWGLLQCYSRVYLGVHFPGDIIGGIAVGVLAGWLVWLLLRHVEHKWGIPAERYNSTDAAMMTSALGITVIGLVIAAIVQTVL